MIQSVLLQKRMHFAPLCLLAALTGCMSLGDSKRVELERPVRPVIGDSTQNIGPSVVGSATTAPAGMTIENAPVLTQDLKGSTLSQGGVASRTGEASTVNVDQLSIKAFVQLVYGNLLKKAISLDARVAQRTDLISLRTDVPLTPSQLAETAKVLLQGFGISVVESDTVVRIVPANTPTSETPMLRRGRASSDFPLALRPIFHLVEVEALSAGEVSGLARTILGDRVTIQDVPARNSLLISGQPDNILAALDIVRSLDQPRMRGRVAKRVTPANVNVQELASRLTQVMQAQGYSVSSQFGDALGPNAVFLLPISGLNHLYVFTSSQSMAEFVVRWASEVDQTAPQRSGNVFFSYPVKFSDASSLAKTLSELMTQPIPVAGTSMAATPQGRISAKVVVNAATNSLIVQGGSPDEHRQIRALLQELDQPVKSALIEVVVAEVALGAKEQLGIEWQLADQVLSRGTIRGSFLGGAEVGKGSIALSFLNSAGQQRGLLTALASSNQARILSSPKIMTRNAEAASIQVGQEVPVVTSQQSSSVAGTATAGVLQQIQYRNTGVILKVKPVILAGGRLDLEVAQEVSNVSEERTGAGTNPSFSTKRVETKLSMRDGGTVMIGGLLSDNSSGGNSGIPGLKDVPGLGALFRSENKSNNKTELIVMITAHVLNDDHEAELLTDTFRQSLSVGLPSRPIQPPVKQATVQGFDVNSPVMPASQPTPKSSSVGAIPVPMQIDPEPFQSRNSFNALATGNLPSGQSGSAGGGVTPTGSSPAGATQPKSPTTPTATGTPRQITDPKEIAEIEKMLRDSVKK